uniref:NADH-ubiquinone oxidoreductase chain 3 n=1 Tax=Candida metapsilosis TaxID=273372 RepID=Q6TN89_9ASCO|nr:NADH dehydrogenase subunit 3 [Candida metapsilosis]AAR26266.1 NADH dehydrogenase subunit 3 [Candida metapsilosis]AAR92139.1 NADH dehydrogenase subunit 3 [Candida metapsilosis]AAX73027.1 NADH dehydrogenase subunit 3 [Candida metapsilosis]AEX57359.1 NADH dehydrogenase subunit 3 [Candida metapsilosis]AEX57374.1 NADH dehydrogenase subunit 3 [Candida metapsilosis]
MFTAYLILCPIVAVVLVGLNWLLATSNSYIEKDGPFECGFTSFQQSRSAFSVAFILVAILFLPFDLEISSILPYVISPYTNGLYGLVILVLFLILLIVAFVVEIQLKALQLNRKYTNDLPHTELYDINIKD